VLTFEKWDLVARFDRQTGCPDTEQISQICQALPVVGTLHQAVQIDHKPVSDCETSVWTYCRDTLTWKGVVIVGRKA
jgi:hypothetical protein